VGNLASTCRAEYETTLPDCFAPGDGVTMATACVATRNTCEDPAQAAQKACTGDCGKARTAALKLCGAADAACTADAQTGYTTCKANCAAQAAIPLGVCKDAYDLCLSHCPNL
jgi:hypothetical protein